MAIGLLATITVQDGKNAEFEEAFLNLTEQVWASAQLAGLVARAPEIEVMEAVTR
jgi:hypothetical protein